MSKLALMFPGQGSQAVGMGCDLCAAHPQMRDTYAEASDVLDFDLEQRLRAGPAEKLARTDVTQPALLANSIGIFRMLAEQGLKFDAAFGHSLGEYSALVATGALVVRRRAALVRRRGREMLRPPRPTRRHGRRHRPRRRDGRGAVRRHRRRLAGQLQLPRPGRGERPARPRWTSWPRRPRRPARKRVLPLAVSGAFHSPLIAGRPGAAARRARGDGVAHAGPGVLLGLQRRLRDRRLRRAARRASSSRRCASPQSVNTLYAAGYDAFLEVGPGSVLSGLVKRIAPEATVARAADADTIEALRDDSRYWEVA